MATASPATLTFHRGVNLAPQVRAVTVTGDNVFITVADSPPGGSFSWKGSPPAGWLLNPPPPPRPQGSGPQAGPAPYKPPAVIPVTFKPTSTAPVQATMTVNVVRNDATRSGIPGFPVDIALEGNVDGVGPGTLRITQIDANPPGPDLDAEFIEIINVTDATLDLQGCRVGDFRGRQGPRRIYSFDSSFTLDPVSSTSGRRFLRIFSGAGVTTSPPVIQLPLNRRAPVWNNAGDTGWIRNEVDQLVDSFTYPTGGSPAPLTPGPPTVTTVVAVPPGGGLAATPISVEEGDRLDFVAAGQVWVGAGFDDSGPNGRGTEPAGIGYPAPDAPPISLIGRIGSAGKPFLVGSASTLFVDDAEGPLFLGVNDYNLGDNWGAGYTCTVTQFRP